MDEKTWEYATAKDLGMAPAARLASARREPGLLSWCAHHGAMTLLDLHLRLCHRMRIEGLEHLPRSAPFVLVANHASHFDALVLASILPRRLRGCAFPIAAGDVFFETPPMAAFAAAMVNALPVWRKKVGRHGLDDLKQRLRAGESVYILFPEGARSRDGKPLAWKPGIGMMVAGTDIPVVPCRLFGCFEAFPPGAVLPRLRRIRVRVGAPMQFTDVPDEREGWNSVAAALRDAVHALE